MTITSTRAAHAGATGAAAAPRTPVKKVADRIWRDLNVNAVNDDRLDKADLTKLGASRDTLHFAYLGGAILILANKDSLSKPQLEAWLRSSYDRNHNGLDAREARKLQADLMRTAEEIRRAGEGLPEAVPTGPVGG